MHEIKRELTLVDSLVDLELSFLSSDCATRSPTASCNSSRLSCALDCRCWPPHTYQFMIGDCTFLEMFVGAAEVLSPPLVWAGPVCLITSLLQPQELLGAEVVLCTFMLGIKEELAAAWTGEMGLTQPGSSSICRAEWRTPAKTASQTAPSAARTVLV